MKIFISHAFLILIKVKVNQAPTVSSLISINLPLFVTIAGADQKHPSWGLLGARWMILELEIS
jgi:hypothetical protein